MNPKAVLFVLGVLAVVGVSVAPAAEAGPCAACRVLGLVSDVYWLADAVGDDVGCFLWGGGCG